MEHVIELDGNPQQSTTPAGIIICIIIKKWSGHPSFKTNLTSHLNLSRLEKERRRSLAGARDDRYVVDYQEEEAAIRE